MIGDTLCIGRNTPLSARCSAYRSASLDKRGARSSSYGSPPRDNEYSLEPFLIEQRYRRCLADLVSIETSCYVMLKEAASIF